MPRELDPVLEGEIEKPVLRPFLAVRIETPDPVYAFTGRGRLSFADSDGMVREWVGAGEIAALDSIPEATDGSATGVRASLFKIPAEFRDDIAEQAQRGALFEVYIGALNEAYSQVEAAQVLSKYRLEDYRITDAGTTITVEVAGESRGIDQRRPAVRRFTDEAHQRRHPGDRFFEFVPRMAEIPILWAKAEQKAVGDAAGAGGNGGMAAAAMRAVFR